MTEEFLEYLNNMYWQNVQYNISKRFCFSREAFQNGDLFIWEYDNSIYITDEKEYCALLNNLDDLNNKFSSEEEYPSILYRTNDKEIIHKILFAINIKDYKTKIKELMNAVKIENKLTLVDN